MVLSASQNSPSLSGDDAYDSRDVIGKRKSSANDWSGFKFWREILNFGGKGRMSVEKREKKK
jgi:hypothetical protein